MELDLVSNAEMPFTPAQVRGIVSAMRKMMFPDTFGAFVAGMDRWHQNYRVQQLKAEIRLQTQGEG